jgi:predicted N-acetyltransferase YhbS
MTPRADRQFEEWFRTPLREEPSDSRFEARRACPSEFERLYDLVDEAFGVKRPRALFDWLYRDNPAGVAHCWLVEERATRRLLCHGALWPWHLAHGTKPCLGYLNGDLCVAPDWQRRGIAEIRRRACDRHPLDADRIRVGWPNEKTQGSYRKHGRARGLVGPLREGALSSGRDPQRPWRRLAAAVRRRALRVDELTHFDSGFDPLTRRIRAWDGLWCPHDAEFLNWRYLAHPTRSYRALAALNADDPAGYCVLRTGGDTALLMEFAAPQTGGVAPLLLQRALEAAREASCQRLAFFAPPGWPHWPLFRASGFAERGPGRFISVHGTEVPDAYRIESWQVLPGDCDDA